MVPSPALKMALALVVLVILGAAAWAAEDGNVDAETRCIAMVAYAEAAGEGSVGMAAVVRVIRNRMADPRFPDGACAVVAARGEFEPVGQSRRLRAAVTTPKRQPDMGAALADFGPVDLALLAEAVRLAEVPDPADPTGGALYFVNPRLMEPAKCPWFAALKRTEEIGGHVFMTHYGEGEPSGGPALDCAQVKKWYAVFLQSRAGRRARKINPAWLVEVEESPLAQGRSCSSGTYDPATRTYHPGGGC